MDPDGRARAAPGNQFYRWPADQRHNRLHGSDIAHDKLIAAAAALCEGKSSRGRGGSFSAGEKVLVELLVEELRVAADAA